MLPTSQIREITIKDYLRIIEKRLWIVVSAFFALAGIVIIYTFTRIPVYSATVSILIEKTSPKIISIEEVYQTGGVDKDYYQTQYKILSSRTLAKKVSDDLNLAQDPEFSGAVKSDSDTVDALLRALTVEPIKESRMVNVRFESLDPIKAARIANTFASLYVQQDLETKSTSSRYAVGWLEQQLNEMKKKLEDAEINLNNYVQENKIVSISMLEQESKGFLDSLKEEQAKVETNIKQASQRYKHKHPKMIALNSELESVKEKIKIETDRLLDLNQKMIQYNVLKREVESNKQLYETLLKRTKEATVSEELQTSNIRVVDPAEVPKDPIRPNKLRNTIMACFLGAFFGVASAIFIEYLDATVKTAEDIEMYVKVPFLGYIPSARREIPVNTNTDIDLICHNKPSSRVAESFRSIRSSIIFSSPEERPLKTIIVTSTISGEGKSTVSINIGTAFAQKNEQIVIIEADMRRQRIAKSLGVDNKEGLSSFLAGAADMDKIIKPTQVPNLFLIPAGPVPPNPAELLTSTKTKTLLDELKKRFDRIIIDSPPVLIVADALILANISDGVIHVIRSSFVNLESVLQGKKRILEAKAKIIGVVLNNVEVEKADPSYYYHYYYKEYKKEDDKQKPPSS